MHISPVIKKDRLKSLLDTLENSLHPGEELLGLLPIYKLGVDTLAVTTGRILTLGVKWSGGTKIVDDIPGVSVSSATVDQKGFSSGRVEVHTDQGAISLGTLPAKTKSDWPHVETILSTFASSFADRSGLSQTTVNVPDVDPEVIQVDEHASSRGTKLIEQLNDLAKLHEEGTLTDEEFAAAKAAVIVSV